MGLMSLSPLGQPQRENQLIHVKQPVGAQMGPVGVVSGRFLFSGGQGLGPN